MNEQGALLLDGAAFDDPGGWLRRHYPGQAPLPLLRGTPYAPIESAGPFLLDAPAGGVLQQAWAQAAPGLERTVWLERTVPLKVLCASLQRRLRIRAPDGREFWLRLADANPLRNAWANAEAWPDGFWHGVAAVWLPGADGPIRAWSNPAPELDCAPATAALEARIVLGWPLLASLAQEPHDEQESQA
jgi:hypothetical protein